MWQQVSSSLQDSFEYSGRSEQIIIIIIIIIDWINHYLSIIKSLSGPYSRYSEIQDFVKIDFCSKQTSLKSNYDRLPKDAQKMKQISPGDRS